MTDLPEDDQPHDVEGPDYVPICARCMRTVSVVGDRWEHDEPQYEVERP